MLLKSRMTQNSETVINLLRRLLQYSTIEVRQCGKNRVVAPFSQTKPFLEENEAAVL